MRGATSAERRVSPTRAARATGKAPWSWQDVSRRALPRKGETAARSGDEWGDAPGKTGRRKQVRKKMRIDVQVLPRQESTAGKASPCVHGGDSVREA